jgi:hypothetical protein
MATLEKKSMNISFAEGRIWPRLECDFLAECSAFGIKWVCKIVDISQRGMGIVSSTKLRRGDTVNISDPSTKARVVWVEKERAGLKVLN